MGDECWLDGLSMVSEISLSCIRGLTGGLESFLLGAIIYTLLFLLKGLFSNTSRAHVGVHTNLYFRIPYSQRGAISLKLCADAARTRKDCASLALCKKPELFKDLDFQAPLTPGNISRQPPPYFLFAKFGVMMAVFRKR